MLRPCRLRVRNRRPTSTPARQKDPRKPPRRHSTRAAEAGHNTHAVQQTTLLFEHFIGSSKQRGRNGQSESLGRLEVDCGFELGRRLHR